MKIIYSWGHNDVVSPYIENQINEWIAAGYDITSINHRKELDISRAWSPEQLDNLYNIKNEKLFFLYNKIEELSKTNDVFIVNYENVYHPDFIKSLKNIYTVIVSGDDPESSDYCSRPYVGAFNHSFAWGVDFDRQTRITEKFLEWGSRRSDWWPYGVRPDMYDPNLTEDNIEDIKKRDIDLVFVGTPWLKLERLVKIKKAFPNIKIYGRGWNLKSLLSESVRYKREYGKWDFGKIKNGINAVFLGLNDVKELSSKELIPLYQRAKIGINIHMSFGPSNVRTYQLPANGVLQVCDCKKGLGSIFDIGKEVVAYDSMDEAIEIIRHYLDHEEERIAIAKLGFARVMRDYKRLNTFKNAIRRIKEGMVKDDIRYFKDGTKIY